MQTPENTSRGATNGDMIRRIGRLFADADDHYMTACIDHLAREGALGDDPGFPWCDNRGPCAEDAHCDDFSCLGCIERYLGQEAK